LPPIAAGNGNELVVRRIIRRAPVLKVRRVMSLRWLGLALVLPLLFVSVAPSRAQDAAAPAAQAKPSEPAPNAAVTARWPQEDTPQHTTGRAPTPPRAFPTPNDSARAAASSGSASADSAEQKPGLSVLLPKDPAPAVKAARAPAAAKAWPRSSRTARAEAQRATPAHVAKAKPTRKVAASPRGQRPVATRARVAKPAAAHAQPPRVAKRSSAKPHRPLALTPPVVRTSRRPS
jgi:hypothetical protein